MVQGKFGAQYKFYGARGALTLDADQTSDKFHTLSFDLARKLEASKQYDWANKARVQLTRAEMGDLLAVLQRARPEFKTAYHGTERNKSLIVRYQNDGLYVQAGSGGAVTGLALTPAEALQVHALALSQYGKNFTGIDAMALMRLVHGQYPA